MASNAEDGGRRVNRWRIMGWGGAATLLALPLVGMRFIDGMVWDETDFIVMGALLGSVGLAAEFVLRRSGGVAYRLAAGLMLLMSFLLVWINLAVGMIGSEDNPHNLFFGGVIAVAWAGAILARFRPAGMVCATVVAAVAQALVAAAGLSTDVRGGVLSLILVAPWMLSAWLFRRAARGETLGRRR